MYNKGDYVLAPYKTGVYIGQFYDRTSTRAVVQVLAVAQHPEQGDLHNPYDATVSFFHQRKALAPNERALIDERLLQPYAGEIPPYGQSLKQALVAEMARAQSFPDPAWGERALRELQLLEVEYERANLFLRD
jgi:kinase-associated protein B